MNAVDIALAGDLDEQARALDTLTIAADDTASVARAHVRRRVFLSDLAAAELPAGCVAELERAGFVRLAGYVHAAQARDAFLDRHPSGEVDVSLDWFRLASPTPPGVDPHAWLARWVRVLDAEPVGPGMAGFTLVREDGRWYRAEWRREDDERPALLRVEPMA